MIPSQPHCQAMPRANQDHHHKALSMECMVAFGSTDCTGIVQCSAMQIQPAAPWPLQLNIEGQSAWPCAADQHYSKWGCIILDEAHERKVEADRLLLALGRACAARKELKLIVMSATIEPEVFKASLEKGGLAGGCAIIEVRPCLCLMSHIKLLVKCCNLLCKPQIC